MACTFRIVLRQDEGFDVHDTREFDVALDSKFAIGRASKNTSKGHLLPAKHNVYIDSPVVSREHAMLTVKATSGAPHVYLTDTKSMHGTFVNGTPLVPNTAKQLSNGDRLQFGVNVSRNESYFLAYKYTFNAELSQPEPFSRGFTVPEAESEEDDIDYVQSRRGSQLNPLVLDDSDAESERSEHSDSEDIADVTMAQLDENAEEYEALLDDDDDDDDSDEEEETANVSIAESDVESDAASVGSIPSDGPDSPFFNRIHYIEEVEDTAATEQVQATPADQSHSFATLSAPLKETPTAQPSMYGDFEYPAIPDAPLLPFGMLGQNPESTMFDSTLAPPLPPRPSQKRQKMWDEAPQEGYGETWLAEEPHITPVYSSAGLTEHAPLFRDMSTHASQQIELPHISSFSPERDPTYKPTADRIQTPPPTLTADVVSSTPPPTRRTGVSITEIVDEQPPTPTSVNSRKRSADDAFKKEAEHDDEKLLTSSLEVAEAVTESSNKHIASASGSPSVEQIAPLSQRPIAQPRSIFRKALRAAGLMVPATALGAAVSVVALTALPESFFTVA